MKFDAPPERIWLQLHGDSEPEYPVTCDEETTWCWEEIFRSDIEYVRADIALSAESLQSELAAVYALLPGYHYMDPPDGGDVSPLEQMRRMAEDARKWREHCGHSNQPLSLIEI